MAEKQKLNPMMIFKLREVLNTAEVYTIGMLVIYTCFALLFYPWVKNPNDQIYMNIALGIGVLSVATISEKFLSGGVFPILRKIYLAPLVYLIYSQVQFYIKVVNPHDFDYLLIQADKALFGLNPTQWLKQFSFPALTEYLQFCYMTFFLMPIIHGVEWHLRKEDDKFEKFSRTIIFGFYVSYLLYFFLPAIGPRFTLHEFANLSNELPGLWLSEFFRSLVNGGGGVPLNHPDPAAVVNRDCMPSGHTMMTLMNIYLGFKFKSRLRYVFAIIGFSLVFATIYLRYHYVVDVVAGVFFAAVALWIEPKLRKFLSRFGFTKLQSANKA